MYNEFQSLENNAHCVVQRAHFESRTAPNKLFRGIVAYIQLVPLDFDFSATMDNVDDLLASLNGCRLDDDDDEDLPDDEVDEDWPDYDLDGEERRLLEEFEVFAEDGDGTEATHGLDDEEMDWEPPREACEPPHRDRTRGFRRAHAARGNHSLSQAVLEVLEFMRSKDLDLPLLLSALSYEDNTLVRNGTARYERTALLVSTELPNILQKWFRPPRRHNGGIKTKGGSRAIGPFAVQLVEDMLHREMVAVGKFMRSKPRDLSEQTLLSIKWKEMIASVQDKAPILWKLLRRCSWTSRQQKRNTLKSPDSVCHKLPSVHITLMLTLRLWPAHPFHDISCIILALQSEQHPAKAARCLPQELRDLSEGIRYTPGSRCLDVSAVVLQGC